MNDIVMALSQMGRGMDDRIAHVAPGEIVIPRQVLDRQPQLFAAIIKAFQKSSNGQVDWRKFVVGSDEDIKNANPATGLSDFDFDSAADGFDGLGFDSTGNDSIESASLGQSEPGIVDFSMPGDPAPSAIGGGPDGGGAMFDPGNQFSLDNAMNPGRMDSINLGDPGATLGGGSNQNIGAPGVFDIGGAYVPPSAPPTTDYPFDYLGPEQPSPPAQKNLIEQIFEMLPVVGPMKRTIDALFPETRSAEQIAHDNQQQADLETASAGMVGGSNSPSPIGSDEEFARPTTAQIPTTPDPWITLTPTPDQIMGPRFVRPPAIAEPRLLGIPADMDELQRRTMIATYGLNSDEGKWRDPFTVEYYKNLVTRALIDDAGNPTPLNLLPIEEQYLREVAGIDVPPTSDKLLDILTGKAEAADRTTIENALKGNPELEQLAGSSAIRGLAGNRTDPDALAQILADILRQRS